MSVNTLDYSRPVELRTFVGVVTGCKEYRDYSGWGRYMCRPTGGYGYGGPTIAVGRLPHFKDGTRVEFKYLYNSQYNSMEVKDWKVLDQEEDATVEQVLSKSSSEKETIECKVKKIYTAKDDGWCFIQVQLNDSSERKFAKGVMPGIREGMSVSLTGKYVMRQTDTGPLSSFSVDEDGWRPLMNSEGVYEFLASDFVSSIGPVIARRIVNHFGDETADIIRDHPERLVEVPGVSEKRIKEVKKSLTKTFQFFDISSKLMPFGVSANKVMRIYKLFGKDSMKKIKANPYILVDVDGISFAKADAVAMGLHFDLHSPHRIIAAARQFLLDQAGSAGHSYYPMDKLLPKLAKEDYLNMPVSEFDGVIKDGIGGLRVTAQDRVYLADVYTDELYVARKVAELATYPVRNQVVNFDRLESRTGITYTDEQKNAIRSCLNSGFSVITGGPGVGKTVTIAGLVSAFKMFGMSVVLAAPTGKAAKRVSEQLAGQDIEASTVHRLLQYTPTSSSNPYRVNKDNPIPADVCIVDETSMLDLNMASHLLDALNAGQQLVFVGDIDQLPAVGGGAVLRDCIDSGAANVCHLTEVMRQAKDCDIVPLARSVIQGVKPNFPKDGGDGDTDVYFLHVREPRERYPDDMELRNQEMRKVHDDIVRMSRELLEVYDPSEVQVLTPLSKSTYLLGSYQLNRSLRDVFNPDGEQVYPQTSKEVAKDVYRRGDRVIQLKNDYDKGVFNGDTGIVFGLGKGKDPNGMPYVMEVLFGDRLIKLIQDDLEQITLAYALSVHKSQGSEYQAVVMPVHDSQSWMLNRNLLYTAMTRAKSTLVLVGSDYALYSAVRKVPPKRFTALAEEIRSAEILEKKKNDDKRQVVHRCRF